jgi:enoyl-CoA hydratase
MQDSGLDGVLNINEFITIDYRLDEEGILTLTLNRPDKLNAMNSVVLDELMFALTHAQLDASVRGILITGAGKAFCAGADITELQDTTASSGYTFSKHGQTAFRMLETLGKPSVCAINGYAFGGGCELAMAATLRIASEKAIFGQPEVKLGVLPGYGGTQRLSRLVGKGRALDLCTTGRSIDANTALMWGLVTDVVPPEDLLTHARARLVSIINNGPLAVSATIEAINNGFDLPLEDALQMESLVFARLCDTDDKDEGTTAFLEKRQPMFTGE